MQVVVAHPLDPFSPSEGGSVRYALNLVRYLESHGISANVLGVQTTAREVSRPTLSFIPVLRGSDHWVRYGLNLLKKVPLLNIPESAVILTLRLDFMVPFVLFKPGNPKIMVSDEPLHYARLRFGRLFPLVAAMYHVVERHCMKRIDLLMTDGRTKSYYLNRYPELQDKLLISPAFVDLEAFKPQDKRAIREEYGFEECDKVIAFVGRVAPVKNMEFLIGAFAIVKAQVPEAKLCIVGRGDPEYEATLKELVDELGVMDVIFTGEIHPDRIPAILGCTDVLALCSRIEGSPTVVKEALACGVPVVSTDVGDVKTIVTDELVGRIAPTDEHGFARALVEVLATVAAKPDGVRKACIAAARPYGLKAFGELMTKAFELALARRGYGADNDRNRATRIRRFGG